MAGRLATNRLKPSKRTAAGLAAAAVVLSLAGWVVLSVVGGEFGKSPARNVISPHTARESSDSSWGGIDPAVMRAADVRPALLCDYYEHGIEHAPPRDPSGCMQRREFSYLAPRLPLSYLRESQGPAVDAPLFRAVRNWLTKWCKGAPTHSALCNEFERLANASDLRAVELINLGRSFQFLDGDSASVGWYRAGLARAIREYENAVPGERTADAILAAIDQTKALWRLKEYAALEQRFSLQGRLHPPLSREARRAKYLRAEMLLYQRRTSEAAELIVATAYDHKRAGDLGHLDRSDLPEMAWVEGWLLFAAGNYSDAIPQLREVVNAQAEHSRDALPVLGFALVRTNSLEEAERILERMKVEGTASPMVPSLAAEIMARKPHGPT